MKKRGRFKRPRLRNQPESAGDSASGLDASGDDIYVGQAGVGEQRAGLVRCSAFYDYASQTAAASERILHDGRHAVADRHTRKPAAAVECFRTDDRHAVRDRHRRQSDAVGKRRTHDVRHAVGYRYARKSAATGECIISDARHVSADFDCLRFFIIHSGVCHRLTA